MVIFIHEKLGKKRKVFSHLRYYCQASLYMQKIMMMIRKARINH
jgi:hypothetical protein